MRYLTVDFGSTYTKLAAIDATDARILGTANAFTTIATDVLLGFHAALRSLRDALGEFDYDELLCCSSAGGGLKMVALGLVPELTAKAAKMAAESAGAKVIRTYAYEISTAEQAEIAAANPDIVLLCGGTDGGNKDVIVKNAALICETPGAFSVIAAGNKSAARELEAIFKHSGKEYVIAKNVMPAFGRLDIAPARNAIRDIFIRHIIDAKGLAGVQRMTKHEIIPTPLAVLKGCELLSLGTKKTPGIGEFMAVDVGGATTDVYSMAKGAPSLDNVLVKGLPEPYSKRTVEGDLGMRYSAGFLLDEAGADNIAEACGVAADEVRAWVRKCTANPETLAPQDSRERAIDEKLAGCAIEIAVERHCGVLEQIYTPMGEMYTLTGKDLSETPRVIGIGGVIKNSEHPAGILRHAVFTAKKAGRMFPKAPAFLLDTRYIFSAMGLVGMLDPELALAIMKQEMQALTEDEHGTEKPEAAR
jgi:uncharacterized protein (TIGR01319 family)